MKKNKAIGILTLSFLVLTLSVYSIPADQHGASMPQEDMHPGMGQNGMPADMQKSMPQGKRGTQEVSTLAGAPIFIGSASLSRIQEKLRDKGGDALQADGIWGHSTAQAVENFQRSQGLAPTGKIDVDTLRTLGLPEILSGDDVQQSGESRWPPVAKRQGAHLYLSPSNLRQIQQKLSRQGYDTGEADGVWGTKTLKAIQQFQQDKGLDSSGTVDLSLIRELGLGQILAAWTISGQSGTMASGQEQMDQSDPMTSGPGEARGYFGQPQREQGRMQDHQKSMGKGVPLFAGPETVRRIQQALRKSGQDPGNMEGKWDQSTRDALKAYQKEQNLEATGNLTISTVQKLIGGFDPRNSGSGSDSQPSTGMGSPPSPPRTSASPSPQTGSRHRPVGPPPSGSQRQ